MEPKNRKVEIAYIKGIYHYFLPGSSNFHSKQDITINVNFDFVTLENNLRKFIIYLEILYPKHADMLFGAHFELTVEDDQLADTVILNSLMDTAVPPFFSAFKQLCSQANIKIDEIEEDYINKASIIRGFQQMIPSRLSDDIYNKPMLEQTLLSFSENSKYHLLLNGTFIIIDQLVMENPYCNRIHNREMIFEHGEYPFQKYVTLRYSVISNTNKKISFNMLDSTFILIAADCAIQILLSPMYDNIEDGLIKKGFNSEVFKQYIKIATEMRNGIKEHLIKSEVIIENLNQQVDWTALIK